MVIYRRTSLIAHAAGVHPCGVHPCISDTEILHGATSATAPETFCGKAISTAGSLAAADAMLVTADCRKCVKAAANVHGAQ